MHRTLAILSLLLSSSAQATGFDSDGEFWHGWFAPTGETPLVGDFDGDGQADVATVTATGRVYVALSTGVGFLGTGVQWSTGFPAAAVLKVGDVDGDHRDDLIGFMNDGTGDVFVRKSTGSSFASTGADLWHGWFAVNGEMPAVGDFTGDGCADIATLHKTNGTVYVATSNCSDAFVGSGVAWKGGVPSTWSTVHAGDVDGDGCDDFIRVDSARDEVQVSRTVGCSNWAQNGVVPTSFVAHW